MTSITPLSVLRPFVRLALVVLVTLPLLPGVATAAGDPATAADLEIAAATLPPSGTWVTPRPAPAGGPVPVSGDDRAGWPVNLHAPGAGFPYTPTLADVDHDGAAEIFLTGGETFGLKGDGSFLPGWPTTEHAYMGYGTNDQKPGPSVDDLEGDGDVEVMWSERDWWAGNAHMWCFNGREANGSNMSGFPQFAPDDYSNALDVPFVLGDSDGDGYLEAWGPHTLGNNFVHYRLSKFDHLGNLLFTRDIGSSENILNLFFGDVDGDYDEEFFAISWQSPTMRLYVFTAAGGDASGYPVVLGTFTSGYPCFGPPVPVDMDRDGDLEFLFGFNVGSTSYAHARHHDGSLVAGYPVTLATSSQVFYLGVGDLTGDGQPELLALENHLTGTNRALAFALADGTPLPGWPFYVNDWPHGYPCVADVDGNGTQDFCFSTEGAQVFALDAGGVVLPGFPKTMVGPSISSVAAGDIDGDGLFELVASTWDGWVHAWDTTGPALPGRADWPMRGIDARNTGVLRHVDPTSVAAASHEPLRLLITPNPAGADPLFRLAGAQSLLTRGPGLAQGVRLEILDVSGRRVDSIVLREGVGSWTTRAGRSPGVYFVRGQVGSEALQGRFVLLPAE